MNDSGYGRKPPRQHSSVPALLAATRGALLGNTVMMRRPYPVRDGGFGHRKSGCSHRNPGGSYSKR